MPLITIIGAGSGLGIEIARAFGHEGFDVALVARTQSKLDALVQTLEGEGIRARGFTADVSAAGHDHECAGCDQGPSLGRSTSWSSPRPTELWHRPTCWR